MIYYISDLHFGHKNILKYDKRPFNSTDEMDNFLITKWNAKVSDEDDVYIIGDICLGNPSRYLERLNGKKHLITGNHDRETIKNCRHYFESIDTYKKIHDGNKTVILFHYPIAEWDGYYRGTYHVYGHIHNALNEAYDTMKKRDLALNAGCMINNFEPATLEELIYNNNEFKRKN